MKSFDVNTTRRISAGLLATSGAMLFTTFNLIGAGVSSNNIFYAENISEALNPLIYSAGFSLISLIFAEIAGHPQTPDNGHPHSKTNYLQSAFVLIAINGLGGLLWGTFELIVASRVFAPTQ